MAFSWCLQSTNHRHRHGVAPGDLRQRLAIAAAGNSSLRWKSESRGLRPKRIPAAIARLRPAPVLSRISSRSNSATARRHGHARAHSDFLKTNNKAWSTETSSALNRSAIELLGEPILHGRRQHVRSELVES